MQRPVGYQFLLHGPAVRLLVILLRVRMKLGRLQYQLNPLFFAETRPHRLPELPACHAPIRRSRRLIEIGRPKLR